jgi:hypothetical protein
MDKSIIQQFLDGKIPTVPFTVSIEDKSIIKVSVAVVIVVTICILISKIVKK